jgi:hypothetical protein
VFYADGSSCLVTLVSRAEDLLFLVATTC